MLQTTRRHQLAKPNTSQQAWVHLSDSYLPTDSFCLVKASSQFVKEGNVGDAVLLPETTRLITKLGNEAAVTIALTITVWRTCSRL